MQLQTFDKDEDYEFLYENFELLDQLNKDNRRSSVGINDTVIDTEAVLQELDEILQMPKGKTMNPQMLEEEDEEATATTKSGSSKPKFSLGLGGLGKDGKPSKVPNLDFSNLKHVKENDWYA